MEVCVLHALSSGQLLGIRRPKAARLISLWPTVTFPLVPPVTQIKLKGALEKDTLCSRTRTRTIAGEVPEPIHQALIASPLSASSLRPAGLKPGA